MGILAAVALPKFVDLTSDARKAKLAAAAGAIGSASAMAHGKFLVTTPAPTTAVFEGLTVTFANGYLNAASIGPAAGLLATDYTLTATATTLTVSPLGVATPASCRVVYTAATATTAPTIVQTATNCS
jgi:MSHA pilin protein MshA